MQRKPGVYIFFLIFLQQIHELIFARLCYLKSVFFFLIICISSNIYFLQCFRAELIIEDRIEYNDLVDSIQDDSGSCEDKSEDVVTSASNDVESNKGNFIIIAIII